MMRARRKFIAVSLVAIAAIGVASAISFAPKLVWNASASAPVGLYKIEKSALEVGDFVLVSPSEEAAKLIAERGYLPQDIPLIKRVAALSGDQICREDSAIFINNTFVATAQNVDSLGRNMPTWSGCFTLRNNEIFLLNDHEKSLDGRYFEATKASDVIGVARPVWKREAAR
ncbi:MAG: S26 family signal peptidase [Parvularculaceae bacterium]